MYIGIAVIIAVVVILAGVFLKKRYIENVEE